MLGTLLAVLTVMQTTTRTLKHVIVLGLTSLAVSLSACGTADDTDQHVTDEPALEDDPESQDPQPSTCPDAAPTEAAACAGELSCSYGTDPCSTILAWCIDGKWRRGGYAIQCPIPDTRCPEAKPEQGGACVGKLHCSYQKTACGETLADCMDGKWVHTFRDAMDC
jgi:hypothetical protein